MLKPSFSDEAELTDGEVRVEGQSLDDTGTDILDIRVVLVQEDRITSAHVDKAGTSWHATLPDPDGPDAGSVEFEEGPAVAFGVETRRHNFTAITWTEPVTIRAVSRS